MLYTLLALVVIIIACALAYRALKILWLSSWFLGFVRGIFGLGILALAGGIGLVAYDIYTYKQILTGQPIATVSFEAIEDQHFDAVVVDATSGKQQRFSLHGDQWQLDTRIITWKGYFSGFNIKPAYRLDRLSGRYYDIEKETAAKRNNFVVTQSLLQLDLWKLINENPKWFSVIDAYKGSASFQPMKSGALYEISLAKTGLTVRPLNDVANKAVSEWK